jgi:hypothetical protein
MRKEKKSNSVYLGLDRMIYREASLRTWLNHIVSLVRPGWGNSAEREAAGMSLEAARHGMPSDGLSRHEAHRKRRLLQSCLVPG